MLPVCISISSSGVSPGLDNRRMTPAGIATDSPTVSSCLTPVFILSVTGFQFSSPGLNKRFNKVLNIRVSLTRYQVGIIRLLPLQRPGEYNQVESLRKKHFLADHSGL